MRWPTPLTPIIIAKLIGGGGGGSVTAAAVLSAMEAMTASQAEDALDAIDGEPKKLVVTVTESGGVYSANKTYTEIEAAIAGGKTVVCNDGAWDYYLVNLNDNDAFVFYNLYVNTDGSIDIYMIEINDDNSVNSSVYSVAENPTTVTDLSSTSITLTAAANTYYTYGELTALTVSSFPASGTFWIVFVSGATPTVVTGIDNFTPEANKRYKVTVENGYATFDAWSTT